MKIKANKILAVLCVIAMVMTMIVPMSLTATAAETEVVATFTLGANGTASHNDGSSKTSYSETVDGYTLNLKSGTSMYTGARDAKGNSCIKLGTSSKTGGFTIEVPSDVVTVEIHAAKYKSKTTKVSVNGNTAQALTKNSNNGEYDVIKVDTSNNKSITFASASGGVRCMINTIIFYVAVDDSGCEHVWGDGVITTPATCTTAGEKTYTCSECGEEKTEATPLAAHTYGEGTVCTECGDIKPDTTLTIEQAIELGSKKAHDTYTDGKYYVAGVITDIYQTTYGNMKITDADGNILTIYGTYSADGSTRYDAMTTKPVVGDTVIIYGIIGQYNNTPQIKNGWLMEIVQDDATAEIREKLNAVQAYMQLSYKYTGTTQTVEVPAVSTVVDTLERATTGITGTTYTTWSDKRDNSNAVYAGQSAGSNSSIQLRSATDKGYSGIISTTSGGNARIIRVVWDSNTKLGRTLDVYGKSTAYTSPEELYSTTTQGTKIGSIVMGSSTELVIEGDYEYIAFRSNDGAMYLTSISIEWEVEAEGGGGTQEVEVLSNSQFVFNCGVDATLAEIEGVDAFGIKVTAGEKEVYYTFGDEKVLSWKNEDGMLSVSIALGDIINDKAKLRTEFTVCAFVQIEGVEYESELTKTYSVATAVQKYDADGEEVAHLFDILCAYGLI